MKILEKQIYNYLREGHTPDEIASLVADTLNAIEAERELKKVTDEYLEVAVENINNYIKIATPDRATVTVDDLLSLLESWHFTIKTLDSAGFEDLLDKVFSRKFK